MRAPIIPKIAQRLVLLVMAGATVWFFFQAWQNIRVLSTRTLPGVAYAAELIDRAAELEIARMREADQAETTVHFERTLSLYKSTVAIDQDRANYENVHRAYVVYREELNRETWLRLRAEISALHAFRIQRAQNFASDSGSRFTSALAVNVAGLALFAVLFVVVSVGFSLRRNVEDRPDNF